MIQNIDTIDDVVTFIKQIAGEIKDFHPLEDFGRYIDPVTNRPRYSEDEATMRNELLNCCFDVCATEDADFFTFLLALFQETAAKTVVAIN